MMPRRRPWTVRLTAHALERWEEHGGCRRLTAGWVRRHLVGALQHGAEYFNGAVEVGLGDGLYAVCVPEPWGGWAVVTVARKTTERVSA